jgi:hypothetical protein
MSPLYKQIITLMMINNMNTNMPPPRTGMTETLLIYEGYSETSWIFKIEHQSDHVALSDKCCFQAVTSVCHLTKVTSSYLIWSLQCLPEQTYCLLRTAIFLMFQNVQHSRAKSGMFLSSFVLN